jgi:hypothetical protein
VLEYGSDLQKNPNKQQDNGGDDGGNMLTVLCELFLEMSTQKAKTGRISPKKFVTKLRKENGERKRPLPSPSSLSLLLLLLLLLLHLLLLLTP